MQTRNKTENGQINRQTVRHSDGQTSRKVWLGTDREHMLEGIQKTDVLIKRFFFGIFNVIKVANKAKRTQQVPF